MEVALGLGGWRSQMPWYVVAWVMVASFAPCRLNSLGTLSDRMLVSILSAPSLASWSLCSLPRTLSCPLIHLKSVVAIQLRRRKATCLKNSAFFTPIQLLSSQVGRCVVRPFIAYFESKMMVRGQNFGKELTAAMMAAISPTWLDCLGPGTRIAAFLSWLGPTHMPLPRRHLFSHY